MPLFTFPRDHFHQVLLVAQRFPLGSPRRFFIALLHRGQMEFLQMPDQRRAHIGYRAHCRTAISLYKSSKLARSGAATSTTVTGGIVSSLRNSSFTDSAVI